jgi:PAS domain S-box-containing protein
MSTLTAGTTPPRSTSLLLIDADSAWRSRIGHLLAGADGFHLTTASSFDDLPAGATFDVCLFAESLGDPRVPLDQIRSHAPARSLVVLTDDLVGPSEFERHARHGLHPLPKPTLDHHSLLTTLRCALACSTADTAAAAAADAESRLEAHFESLPNPTYVWRSTGDDDFHLVRVNGAAHALTKGRIGALIGERATAFFSHRPDIVEVLRQCLRERRPQRSEGPYMMRTIAEERYLMTTYTFVPPDVVIGHTEDATERKRAERALLERDREFRALFENAKDALLIADDAGQFVNANPAALALLGVTRGQLQAMRVSELAVGERRARDEAWRHFLEHGHQEGRMQVRRRDGLLRTVDFVATAHYAPGRHLWVLRDMTDRVELERELHHVQRLDSVGRLAGGIAHDFNNLLTAILGFAELLANSFAPDDPRRTDMAEIQRAAESAAGLTRQLLAFSRKQVMQPIVFDLNEHIGTVTTLLRRLLGETIEVRSRFLAPVLNVTADPTQMEQILLNLAINSRDAMPEGGTLDIVADRVTIAPDDAREGTTLVPGVYARLTVTDTGHGMTPQTMAHIFEPFFTTKPRGSGTGLGLSTVYGIVRQSNGYIWVSSQPGAGTSFELLFPESSAAPRVEADEPASLPRVVPSATILVVDDDRAVRLLTARTLERQGFAVLQAASAREAHAHVLDASVSLLITDVVMPDTSGVDLAATLLARDPRMKVLFMTGYAADAIAAHEPLPGAGELIHKPFTPDRLVSAVVRALDHAAR